METFVATFEAAAELIDRAGFLLLSRNPLGFPSLEAVTAPEAWHTGAPTDPWIWKDRLAAAKRAAYTRVFRGRPGFISLAWYPSFLAACRPERSLEGRYRDGVLGSLAYRLARLLEDAGPLGTHEMKARLRVGREEKREFENALLELQADMEVTVAGAARRLNREGEPYGWLVSRYDTVRRWAGADLLAQAAELDREEARREIVARVRELLPGATEKEVGQVLGFID